MKFIYFLIIVVIIYFIATQIKLVHIDSIPEEKKIELKTKSKMRSMIMENHVKDKKKKTKETFNSDSATFGTNKLIGLTNKYSADQYNSRDYKDNYWDLTQYKPQLPNANNLFYLIRSEYRDEQFKFNISNQPVTTRYPSKDSEMEDKKYLKHIKRNILQWNELFQKYYNIRKNLIKINSIKMLFVMETLNEFYIKVQVSLSYLKKTMHFELTYYGQIYRNDDFLRGASDTYVLQLIDIKPITKSEYDIQPEIMTQNQGPFMSLEQQVAYAEKVNKMHREEAASYK